VTVDDRRRAADVLRTLPGEPPVAEDGDRLTVNLAEERIPEMVRLLVGAGVGVKAVVPAPEAGLEDVFLELTGAAPEQPRPSRRRRFGRLR